MVQDYSREFTVVEREDEGSVKFSTKGANVHVGEIFDLHAKVGRNVKDYFRRFLYKTDDIVDKVLFFVELE